MTSPTDSAPNTSTLAVALNVEGDTVPEWIELIPPGPKVRGRDGRQWLHDRPDAVITAFNQQHMDLPLDYEHATELKAPKGEQAPAAGWIQALEQRAGSIWGRVAWNSTGRTSVSEREYRYISPVFLYERQSNRVAELRSAALTNSPNLSLTALNQQQEQSPMDPEILAALNLTEGDTTAVVTAINALKTAHEGTKAELGVSRGREATPDLSKFVPRSDYDAALNRAATAEATLQTQVEEARNAEIDTAITAALEAGKITPASVEYHTAACSEEGGLERFKTFVEAAPKIIPPDSGLDGKPTPDSAANSLALTAEEKAICRVQGLDEDAYLKTKSEMAEALN